MTSAGADSASKDRRHRSRAAAPSSVYGQSCCTVENARDLNRVGLHLINDDVRQWSKCQLTPPSHAAASSSKGGEIPQMAALFIDRSSNAAGSFGIVAMDPPANAL